MLPCPAPAISYQYGNCHNKLIRVYNGPNGYVYWGQPTATGAPLPTPGDWTAYPLPYVGKAQRWYRWRAAVSPCVTATCCGLTSTARPGHCPRWAIVHICRSCGAEPLRANNVSQLHDSDTAGRTVHG